jgi:hypothetical protein
VLGAIVNVSASTGEAYAPQVATDANGAGVITWARLDPVSGFDRIQARTITSAGALGGTTSDLSAVGADASAPQVSVASTNGAAVVTWERAGGAQVSKGP